MENVIYDPQEIVRILKDDTVIGFDTETTGLSPWKNSLALIQMVGKESKIPCIVQCRDGEVPEIIHAVFRQRHRLFVGHNITAFDLLFLGTHGIPWEMPDYYDTLTAECIISTTGRRDVSKSLRESVRRRLGIAIDKDIAHGEWNNEVLTDRQIEYAVEDIMHLIPLMETQKEKATAQEQLGALEFEMKTIKPIVRMTLNGLPLKQKILRSWLREQTKLRQSSMEKLHSILGEINLNSPVQIKKAIINLGLEFENTKVETLTEISMNTGGQAKEIADLLLDYRGPAQRLKMYNDKWQMQHMINDYIHPRFWSASTDTLRMSSSDPNIQQVPANGRKIFGNVDGYQVVWCDYSQIEVRIAAYIAQDEILMELLKTGDVHSSIASKVFGIPPEQVSKEQRNASKAMTFLLIFGGGVDKLYNYMRLSGSTMTYDEVSKMFDAFFIAFPGLMVMRQRAYAMSQNQRVIQLRLPNGAKRLLVGMKKAPTVILNTMVQGTAAIGIKRALQLCYERGLINYIGAAVHDEIVALVPNAEVEKFEEDLMKAMVDGMNEIVPNMYCKAEVKHGEQWDK